MKKSTYVICAILAILGVAGLSSGNFLMFVVFILLAVGIFGASWQKSRRKALNEAALQTIDPNAPLPVVLGSNVLLTSGETCHYHGSANRYILKERVTGYTGGGGGVSVRIAKGVTYRTGSRQSRAVREKVAEKTPGFLSVTNKRVVFASAKDSFDKKLSALSTANPLDDGIVLQFGDKQYMLETNDGKYIFQLIQRIMSESTL